MRIHFNPQAIPRQPAPAHVSDTVDADMAEKLLKFLESCPAYKPTPLYRLSSEWTEKSKVGDVFYKDEGHRFSLQSFKALGATYAVAKVLHRLLWPKRREFDPTDLFDAAIRKRAKRWTVACATDGNHGRAVAVAARLFGCGCVIFLHSGVSLGREAAIAATGAKVVRVPGDYDESVHEAQRQANQNDWVVVSDTSYPGYEEIPRWVMEGYTVMFAEVLKQLPRPVTHVFVQAGVGGLAAAAAAYLWQRLGPDRPTLIVVEPTRADCLFQSAQAGEARTASGPIDTLLAGLACGEVSGLAWEILRYGADAFMLIDDEDALKLMKPLANEVPSIVAGESATAGLAGLLAVASDTSSANTLGLSRESQVLVFGTEGATDLEIYNKYTQ
jgi:diaminopropionate ammonia-lyase